MKQIFIAIAFGLLVSCSGKEGDIGLKGDKGEQGVQGEKGIDGQNGSQAYTYDFELDVTKSSESYKFNIPVDNQEFVLLFLKKNSEFYTSLPYYGYAFAVDGTFQKLDMTYDFGTYSIYVDNYTNLPSGTKFKFRAVVVKGVPGGRLKADAYLDYQKLKKEFNLPE